MIFIHFHYLHFLLERWSNCKWNQIFLPLRSYFACFDWSINGFQTKASLYVRKTAMDRGCSQVKNEKLITDCKCERISLLTHRVQGLLAYFVNSSPRMHSQRHTHARTHTSTHFLFFLPHLKYLFPDSFLPTEHWLKSAGLCCGSHICTTGLQVTHGCIPKSWVLLTLRCGSVLRVYTGGKGVNATCFKEVQDVFTSALTGTLGKSWN